MGSAPHQLPIRAGQAHRDAHRAGPGRAGPGRAGQGRVEEAAMSVEVIGAGVGRTGTLSLKTGLEQLLGRPSYHMVEILGRPEHARHWRTLAEGGEVDWSELIGHHGATTDFPACLFWREILAANPEALVLLSTRKDPDTWWKGAAGTIFAVSAANAPPDLAELVEAVVLIMSTRFSPDLHDRDMTLAAYERHNGDVPAAAPAGRLVEWQASDGWGPLSAALGTPVPNEPFPYLDKAEDVPTTLPQAIERFDLPHHRVVDR